MSSFMKTERNGKTSFLNIEVIHELGKLLTTIYCKPTFGGVYGNLESFLPSVYEFGMAYALLYRYFHICSILCEIDFSD